MVHGASARSASLMSAGGLQPKATILSVFRQDVRFTGDYPQVLLHTLNLAALSMFNEHDFHPGCFWFAVSVSLPKFGQDVEMLGGVK